MTLENGNLESLEARFLVGLDCSGRTWSLQVVIHTVVLWHIYVVFLRNKVQVLNEEILGTWCSKRSFREKKCRRRLSYDLSSKASPPCGHSVSGCRSLGLKTLRFLNDVNNAFHLEVTLHIPKNKVYTQAFQIMWPHYKSFKGSDCHAKKYALFTLKIALRSMNVTYIVNYPLE